VNKKEVDAARREIREFRSIYGTPYDDSRLESRGPAVESRIENGKRVNICHTGGRTIKVYMD
jgi:hypothetical protein